ncbi:MAG: hypothetical protein ACXVCR_01575 [Bdellovibrio sp.]
MLQILLQEWVRTVELDRIHGAQQIRSYKDHSLKGNRNGQRSASLDYSYRVIYIIIEDNVQIVEILEVTKHDYRTK